MKKADGTFSLLDYVVFGGMLVISAAIGLFYAYKERHKKSVDHLLLGGRKLKVTIIIWILSYSNRILSYSNLYLINRGQLNNKFSVKRNFFIIFISVGFERIRLFNFKNV